MDNSGNGKRPIKPAPFMKFPPPQSVKRIEPFTLGQPAIVSDGLQPGTLPSQPFQFNPYMSGMVNTPKTGTQGKTLSFNNPPGSTSPSFMDLVPVQPNVPDKTPTSRSISTREHFMRINSQESVGKLKIEPNAEPYDFVASDLEDHGEIGRGAFGAVNRMVHVRSNTEMAVKRIRSTVDEREQKQLLMDLEVVMRSSDCPCIVKFYGALFWEGDCWICMELMSTSLDKFYRFVYHRQNGQIPEDILGKIAVATVKALDYLKEKLQIMHRDVKPSNILIDKKGNIKLCDFGISGQLVNSIAKTRDAGCRPYMAPERIDTSRSKNGYDVRSDVWSLGITLIELSTGKFPYPKWKNVFDQLTQVVKGLPPKLRNGPAGVNFSDRYIGFVNMLTIAEAEQRPKYDKLLATSYLLDMADRFVDVATYFSTVLNSMTEADFFSESNSDEAFRG